MMLQDSKGEMQDRVGELEKAMDDAVNYGLPLGCTETLRKVGFRTHLDVICRALFIDLLVQQCGQRL